MKRPRRRLKKQYRIALRVIVGIILLLVLIRGVRSCTAKKAAPETTQTSQKAASKKRSTVKQATAKPSKAQIEKRLKSGWQQVIADEDADIPVSIAVYSKAYGVTVAMNNAPSTAHTTASILKVAMLAKLLHNHQGEGTKLTAAQRTYAEGAIENSDNASATALYHAIGSYAGLNALFATLKMPSSHASSSGWVWTTTTASDQLKLLNQVFYKDDYLSTASRTYIRSLMGQVQTDQQWGISAGAKAFKLKNGWRLNGDNTWIVNSIGYLGSGKNSCTIAILTDRNSSLQTGIDFVEALAKQTGKVLALEQ